MVHSIVNKHRSLAAAVGHDDIRQVAMIAGVRAARTYDESRDACFSTHLTKCVLNSLRDLARSTFRTRTTGNRIAFVSTSFQAEDGGDNHPPDHRSSYDKIDDRDEARTYIRSCLRHLADARLRKIIYLKYGLGRRKPFTTEQIAARFNMTSSAAKTAVRKAICVMQQKVRTGKLGTNAALLLARGKAVSE